ncbi:MAG: glycoside hydrolase family 15 protein [Sedimentisphaeraceae bacterium JB056]
MNNLDYGIIGNCKSAALINKHGTIEWCCLPNFDSAFIFASLLDKDKGGSFGIEPVGDYEIKQSYMDKTNILKTKFTNGNDCFAVIDFMPRWKEDPSTYHCPSDVVRYVKHISGRPRVIINYDPKPGYAKYEPVNEVIEDKYIKTSTKSGQYESIYLYSDIDLNGIDKGEELEITNDHYLVLSYNQKINRPDLDKIKLSYQKTKAYWMDWSSRGRLPKKYKDLAERSSLTLKMLAYQKSGAVLAAVTTSLPETIGSVRNWDYRFCWIRDASMTINVMANINHYNVVKRFLAFILDIIPYKDEKIQIMYGIDGQRNLAERDLDWLDGYEGSKPVRIGNDAWHQKQNDIFGILLDAIFQSLCLFNGNIKAMDELWTIVRTLLRHVETNWRNPDKGIWEFRSQDRHFVFSKILCWVAADRTARIASIFNMRDYVVKCRDLAEEIRKDIMANGISETSGCFTQAYGEDYLDAANLLAEQYGFISAQHPVYIKTVEKTYERLCHNGLMYRYRNEDDFGLPESSFTVCSFWMIKALWKTGRTTLAEKMFQDLISHSNHLGLLSEDIDFESRRLLGNFPQAYSHLALIDCAFTLSGQETLNLDCNIKMPDVGIY